MRNVYWDDQPLNQPKKVIYCSDLFFVFIAHAMKFIHSFVWWQFAESRRSIEKEKGLQSSISSAVVADRKKSSSPADEAAAASSSASKKPIHLRLGAMTKTWKPSKKTWKIEKVFPIFVWIKFINFLSAIFRFRFLTF